MDFLGFKLNELPSLTLSFTPAGWGDDVDSKAEVVTPVPKGKDKPPPKDLKATSKNKDKGTTKPAAQISVLCTREKAAFRTGSKTDALAASHRPLTMTMNVKALPDLFSISEVFSKSSVDAVDPKSGLPKVQMGSPSENTITGYNTKVRPYCGGSMLAVFRYDGDPVSFDALGATAYNLCDGGSQYALHTDKGQTNQVHTEQLLCGQLDAFLQYLSEHAADFKRIPADAKQPASGGKGSNTNNNNNATSPALKPDGPKVVKVPEPVKKPSLGGKEVDEDTKDGDTFDLARLSVQAQILFKHRTTNKVCAACSRTITALVETWGPQLKFLKLDAST